MSTFFCYFRNVFRALEYVQIPYNPEKHQYKHLHKNKEQDMVVFLIIVFQ